MRLLASRINCGLQQVIILLSIALMFFLVCSRQPERKPSATSEELPDQILENSVVTMWEGNLLATYLHAQKIARFEKRDLTRVWTVKADFYDNQGKHYCVLTADSGNVREAKQLLTVYGHVVVTYDRGDRFETDSLFWDGNKEYIETDTFVKIFRKEGNMQGYGLETDSAFKRFKIKRKVKGTYTEVPEDSVLEEK